MNDYLHHALVALRDAADGGGARALVPAEAAALLAEVERLRAEVATERADVVAFVRYAAGFRTREGKIPVVRLPDYLDTLRELIEAGDHVGWAKKETAP